MLHTIFDVETTGFDRAFDDVLSAAYLTLNEKNICVDRGLLYFYREGVVLKKEAMAVNGLTHQKLLPYINDYERNMRKLYSIYNRGNLVGYRVNFDIEMCDSFLNRFDLNDATINSSIDMYPVFKQKGLKNTLRDVVERAGLTPAFIRQMHKIWFLEEPDGDWHSATYDVTATALLYLKAKGSKLI